MEPHAALVRDIFQRYLELGNVRRVAERLEHEGVFGSSAANGHRQVIGGVPLSRGQLYTLLKNELYIGIIAHNGHRHPALHQPIIDSETWGIAQAKLADNLQGHRTGARAKSPSLLAGKVFDAAGQPLTSVHATKPGKAMRYRYYVSRALHEMTSKEGYRIPARELEAVVTERLAKAFDDPLELLTAASLPFHIDQLMDLDQRGREVASALRQRGHAAAASIIEQVRIEDRGIIIGCATAALCDALGVTPQPDAPPLVELVAEVRLTRSGRAMRLIDGSGRATGTEPNRPLVGLLIQARNYWAELRKGELNITGLAEREGVKDGYITRVLRLAFLSPEIIEAVMRGAQPANLSSSKVMISFNLQPNWGGQRDQLLERQPQPKTN